MTVRLLILVAVLATSASAAASTEEHDASPPPPLRGIPLNERTGLRLLVANAPPFMLDVDTGRFARLRGIRFRDAVISTLAVGRDAVVWVDRRTRTSVPDAEIYFVKRGASKATRLATGWEIAPTVDGRGIWLKSYSRRRCLLRELGLDGRNRRAPRPVPCSTHLVDAGARALLVRGRTVVDPSTGRTLLRTGGLWAMSGKLALSTTSRPPRSLLLSDLRSGGRWAMPWPSRIGGRDQAVVQPGGGLLALAFSDPAYEGGSTQVTDVWLLDPAARTLQHIPDMPSAVSLKFTSMAWTDDGRLVMLAESGRQQVVAVWRPGEKRISIRRVRLPTRNGGSDSFVVWQAR